jgi:hypothetical protein
MVEPSKFYVSLVFSAKSPATEIAMGGQDLVAPWFQERERDIRLPKNVSLRYHAIFILVGIINTLFR